MCFLLCHSRKGGEGVVWQFVESTIAGDKVTAIPKRFVVLCINGIL